MAQSVLVDCDTHECDTAMRMLAFVLATKTGGLAGTVKPAVHVLSVQPGRARYRSAAWGRVLCPTSNALVPCGGVAGDATFALAEYSFRRQDIPVLTLLGELFHIVGRHGPASVYISANDAEPICWLLARIPNSDAVVCGRFIDTINRFVSTIDDEFSVTIC